VHINRDTSTIVDYLDPTFFGYKDIDFIAVPSKCFVNRVINNFVNKMVKTAWTSRSDIHSWFSFSDFGFVATFRVVLGAALAGAFTAFVAFFAGSFLTAIYEMLL